LFEGREISRKTKTTAKKGREERKLPNGIEINDHLFCEEITTFFVSRRNEEKKKEKKKSRNERLTSLFPLPLMISVNWSSDLTSATGILFVFERGGKRRRGRWREKTKSAALGFAVAAAHE
jgi:hypothetical protein